MSLAARVLPSGLNVTAVMLELPRAPVQRAAAISHRQIFSEAMASVLPDGLKASAATETKRQADGRARGTRLYLGTDSATLTIWMPPPGAAMTTKVCTVPTVSVTGRLAFAVRPVAVMVHV